MKGNLYIKANSPLPFLHARVRFDGELPFRQNLLGLEIHPKTQTIDGKLPIRQNLSPPKSHHSMQNGRDKIRIFV